MIASGMVMASIVAMSVGTCTTRKVNTRAPASSRVDVPPAPTTTGGVPPAVGLVLLHLQLFVLLDHLQLLQHS